MTEGDEQDSDRANEAFEMSKHDVPALQHSDAVTTPLTAAEILRLCSLLAVVRYDER